MNIQSTIKNPTDREKELLACLETTLVKLAQAGDYINHLGGCNEAIDDINTHLNVNPYLNQYEITVPVFQYEGKDLPAYAY